MGKYITDGSVKWIVEDIRFNVPVGVVFYDSYLHDGCVKFNGATVNRADYVRLEKLANDKNLWTDDPSTEPYKYGRGDGSTTMVLPDFRNRVIQGGDTLAVIEPGLPNILGQPCLLTGIGDYTNGAFYSTSNSVNGSPASEWSAHPIIKFDASRSSAIYGNSDTVQPPALQLIPQIKY